MSCYDTNYQIGDKLHVSGFSNVDFSVNVTITGIADRTLASMYQDLLLLLFNNDSNDEYYLRFTEQMDADSGYAKYFYICQLIDGEESAYANEDGIIILCDEIIIDEYTYKLEDELNINLAITFSSYLSGYTSKEALLADIEAFLSDKNLEYTVTESLSDTELADRNLQDAMSLLAKIEELEDCEAIIEDLKSINSSEIQTTYLNMISLLQNQIDILIQKIDSLQ